MKILAADTSCDDSCVAILDTESWTLLSDVVHSHASLMEKYGGIVPEIASREHLKGLPLAFHEALDRASLTADSIDWYCVTNRPGLIGALLVGVSFIKAMAYAVNKPFSVLNHIEAHLYSPHLGSVEGNKPPPYPWLALVVSGGHTELFSVTSDVEHQWLGGTLDDAAGEAFDKIGKLIGLPYPAGPRIDRWVREEALETDRQKFQFPRAETADYHFSFSGLKTAVALQAAKLTPKDHLGLVASAQEAILDALVVKIRKAQSLTGIPQIVVTGGVACNSRLRSKLPEAYFPSPKHCSDNAAMVALLGGLRAKNDRLTPAPWNTSAVAHLD